MYYFRYVSLNKIKIDLAEDKEKLGKNAKTKSKVMLEKRLITPQ